VGEAAELPAMNINAGKITFRPLREKDLPLMHKWFNTPHVSEWWKVNGKNLPSLKEVERKYLPRIHGTDPVDCYLIIHDSTPIGMVQSCKIDDFPAEKTNFGLDRSCAGIDICIGEEGYVHRGLGNMIIRKFLKEIAFVKYDVDCCIVDPYAKNETAIKAYNKAGFKYLKTVLYQKENEQEHILIINRNEIEPDKEKERVKSKG
jgi:RimJ/RimL family protein N-acetyltransferase